MQKLYSLCKKCLQPLFCATAGILYMTMLTAQPVFAEDVATGGENIWSRFSTIMQDVYGELVAISTIVAVTVASIALIIRMVSRNQRAVDEATGWLQAHCYHLDRTELAGLHRCLPAAADLWRPVYALTESHGRESKE